MYGNEAWRSQGEVIEFCSLPSARNGQEMLARVAQVHLLSHFVVSTLQN